MLDQVDPFLRYNYELSNKPTSIADNIVFDLFVKTEKNIYVTINFNELTGEELFGEINGNVEIENKQSKDFRFHGSMNIVGDSYYRIYYKNFMIEKSQLVFDGPYDDPKLQITARYKNIRYVENNNQEIVYVILNISGSRYKPVLTFKLQDNTETEMTGPDETSNALSYLLFGQPLNFGNAQRTDILSNLGNQAGSSIISAYLSSVVREVAPFILNTELNYKGGSFTGNTDIRITSEIGGAVIRFGGKVFSDINNAEVNVEYPLNKLLNMDISNNLLLVISRVIVTNTFFNSLNTIETGIGIAYKINF